MKVYRTPIGFHDAYVAASSQKAALQAWGSDADLFARGVAEVVDDPALTAEPLANPGKVIRMLRGTADEQLAAAKVPDRPMERASETVDEAPSPKSRSRNTRPEPGRRQPVKKPKPPRPDRHALDAAEKAIEDARAKHDAEDDDWRRRRDELERERRRLDREQGDERERLARAVEQTRDSYDRAVRLWRAEQ